MDLSIRVASATDAGAVADIYNRYVAGSHATFETAAVPVAEMRARIAAVAAAALPWLVAETPGGITGYAYAKPWRERSAYRHSVETSVYLDPARTGRGMGRALYATLIDTLRPRSIHAVIGGVALPNDASVALHERLGFRKVAHFEQVGFKQDRWIDVGYWQLLF